MTKDTHEWCQSTLNHGTRQCWKCLMTYEEATAIGEWDCLKFLKLVEGEERDEKFR